MPRIGKSAQGRLPPITAPRRNPFSVARQITELRLGGKVRGVQSIMRQALGAQLPIGANPHALVNKANNKHYFVLSADSLNDLAKTPNHSSGADWELA